ncbi:unnamed protein product [Periconia digitata]|uniref:Altered inheritance of mitochondria protein 6 n=1 Tax=Periconia digitata TaxID=1303443 RepID=A0A9W4UVQ3_9PLEO|nr:unnamed protein product [Periconia digitata]
MAYIDGDATTTRPLLSDFESSNETVFVCPQHRKEVPLVSVQLLQENGESEFEDPEELRKKDGVLRRLVMAIVRRRQRNGSVREREEDQYKLDWENGISKDRCSRGNGICSRTGLGGLVIIIIIVSISIAIYTHNPNIPPFLREQPPLPLPSPPTLPDPFLESLTKHVTPIPCHSHNDYWRPSPLYDALRTGCTSVEADVWHFPPLSPSLYVGHDTSSLTPSHTLSTMYISPLLQLLDFHNTNLSTTTTSSKFGIFPTSPSTTLILLIDFKNNGSEIFPALSTHLAPLREKSYLSHFNGTHTNLGPITVVATGNAPFATLMTANTTYRDIFYDAPLHSFSSSSSSSSSATALMRDEAFSTHNSYLASTSLRAALGGRLWWVHWTRPWAMGRISGEQRGRIREQIRGARETGLRARYWGTPGWPVGVRDAVWKVLVEEGVDFLNGDDLEGLKGMVGGEGGEREVEVR